MTNINWEKEFDCAITICDTKGVIIAMNDKSIEIFQQDGGAELIGKNLLDCHPEPARSKLAEMLINQKKNVYTIEKNGVRKLICQSPWYEDGEYKGFVELSINISNTMPHFKRSQE